MRRIAIVKFLFEGSDKKQSILSLPFTILFANRLEIHYSLDVYPTEAEDEAKVGQLLQSSSNPEELYDEVRDMLRDTESELLIMGNLKVDSHVTASLVLFSAETANILWSIERRGELDEILELQSVLARELLFFLDIYPSAWDLDKIEEIQTDSFKAFSEWASAVNILQMGIEEDERQLDVSKELLEEAEQHLVLSINTDPLFIEPYRILSEIHMTRGDAQSAVDVLENYLEHEPDNAVIMGDLAHTYLQIGMTDLASKIADKLVESDPINFRAHQIRWTSALRERSVEEALFYLREASINFPDHPDIKRDLTVAYLFDQDPDQALTLLHELLAHNPNEAGLWVNLGQACEQKEDIDGAVQAYRRAIDLDPSDPMPFNNLGSLFLRINQLDSINHLLDRAIELAPVHPFPYLNKATFFEKQEDYHLALECYQQCIDNIPDYMEVWLYLGRCYAKLADYEPAIKAFRTLLKEEPDLIDGWVSLVEVLVLSEQLEEARAAIKSLERLPEHPTSSEILLPLAEAVFEAGEVSTSTKIFSLAHQLSPGDSKPLVGMGRCLIMDKQVDVACDIFAKALANKPSSPLIMSWMGLCEFYRGELATAKELLSRVVENISEETPKFVLPILSQVELQYGNFDKFRYFLSSALLEAEGNLDVYLDICKQAQEDEILRVELLKVISELLKTAFNKHTALFAGKAYLILGKLKSVIATTDKAIEQQFVNAEIYYTRGVAQSLLGDEKDALESWNRSLEDDPNHLRSLFNLGVYHYKANCPDLAITLFSRFLELEPDDDEALAYLKMCEERMIK